LVVLASSGELFLYDISRRETKSVLQGKNLASMVDAKLVQTCAVNVDGTFVAFLYTSASVEGFQVACYDVENDKCSRLGVGELGAELDKVFWDEQDPRLLLLTGSRSNKLEQTTQIVYYTAFVSADRGVRLHDEQVLDDADATVLGCKAPHMYTGCHQASAQDGQWFQKRLLPDFEGIENLDDSSIKPILDVSFALTMNDLDEAFKAVHKIKGQAIWENMARMCIKCRRLEGALTCLGYMGNSRVIMSLKQVPSHDEIGQLAHIAIHFSRFLCEIEFVHVQIDMLEDAEQMYRKANRYKDLAALKLMQQKWPEALEITEKHDRVNLKHIHYQQAKIWELKLDYELAAEFYEKSGCGAFEIPRMCLDHGLDLSKFVETIDNPVSYLRNERFTTSCRL
jgi:intraflagellar transport protein 140